ncbi:MAG: isoprenyl transferase [Phycisphaerales bacterium]|nr:isoprenyl transferase [Phycisphaerales bacterium]
MSETASPATGTGFTDPEAIQAYARIRAKFPAEAQPDILLPDVHPMKIPRHVAVIMDGNGRWAQERGFPRIFGHKNGTASVRTAIETCAKLGIEALTLYSFSSENWSRPDDEIQALMELCIAYCDGEREHFVRHNICVRIIGRRKGMPSDVVESLDRLEDATKNCTGLTLCLAVNYGSRDEIVDAIKSIAQRVVNGEINTDDIDHALVSDSLYTAGIPDPDMLIRTGGDFRISNYLLWQISYAELYVVDQYWPDFDEQSWLTAVRAYALRKRRFGGLDGDQGDS